MSDIVHASAGPPSDSIHRKCVRQLRIPSGDDQATGSDPPCGRGRLIGLMPRWAHSGTDTLRQYRGRPRDQAAQVTAPLNRGKLRAPAPSPPCLDLLVTRPLPVAPVTSDPEYQPMRVLMVGVVHASMPEPETSTCPGPDGTGDRNVFVAIPRTLHQARHGSGSNRRLSSRPVSSRSSKFPRISYVISRRHLPTCRQGSASSGTQPFVSWIPQRFVF